MKEICRLIDGMLNDVGLRLNDKLLLSRLVFSTSTENNFMSLNTLI